MATLSIEQEVKRSNGAPCHRFGDIANHCRALKIAFPLDLAARIDKVVHGENLDWQEVVLRLNGLDNTVCEDRVTLFVGASRPDQSSRKSAVA